MTTISEHTNVTPEVPTWLNLDGYCPPEIRQRLKAATDKVERLVDSREFDETCREAYEAFRAWSDATACCDMDDHGTLLGDFTGYTRFEDVTQRLQALAACACGDFGNDISNDVKMPDWYDGDDTADERALVEWAAAEGKS